jgi:hypothetical protein
VGMYRLTISPPLVRSSVTRHVIPEESDSQDIQSDLSLASKWLANPSHISLRNVDLESSSQSTPPVEGPFDMPSQIREISFHSPTPGGSSAPTLFSIYATALARLPPLTSVSQNGLTGVPYEFLLLQVQAANQVVLAAYRKTSAAKCNTRPSDAFEIPV